MSAAHLKLKWLWTVWWWLSVSELRYASPPLRRGDGISWPSVGMVIFLAHLVKHMPPVQTERLELGIWRLVEADVLKTSQFQRGTLGNNHPSGNFEWHTLSLWPSPDRVVPVLKEGPLVNLLGKEAHLLPSFLTENEPGGLFFLLSRWAPLNILQSHLNRNLI